MRHCAISQGLVVGGGKWAFSVPCFGFVHVASEHGFWLALLGAVREIRRFGDAGPVVTAEQLETYEEAVIMETVLKAWVYQETWYRRKQAGRTLSNYDVRRGQDYMWNSDLRVLADWAFADAPLPAGRSWQ